MFDFNKLTEYELIKAEDLKDISAVGYYVKHIKSGAKLALISNTDDNKVFSIAFRTTPTDETGVPHIVEHTVLCGSKKYPLKDPFVDLVKGSLNTFLNAMTYPDKTMYPIASYNDQDFKNLMDVYLDAVFAPNLLKEEKIFKQEGWHYEMEDEESELIINGVVYNEMKGAYSSEDEILMNQIMRALYPDNTYSQDSGGNPEKIPELTYQAYMDFYHTYYHPSNSYIYLYGDFDIEERLRYLDQEYLSKYDVLEMHTEVTPQKKYDKPIEVLSDYPVSSDDSTENKTYLSYNWMVGEATDVANVMAMDVLDYALVTAPGAPVMKALLDAGIGEDVYSTYEGGIRQGYFSIVAKGANDSDKEKFVSIIEAVLRDQVKNGINKNSLLASINSSEFRFREADFGRFPKGLMYGIQIMDSWLYDDNQPFEYMKCLDIYADLKKNIETGFFEKLLQEMLLDNNHRAVVVLSPNPGKNIREEEKLKEQLAQLKSSMSNDEIKDIVRMTKELHEYQEAKEDESIKNCLPMLTREDLKKETMPISNICETNDDVLYVRHDYETNGIDYVSYYFDIEDLEPEKLPLLSLLTTVMGSMDTENYSYLELSNATNIYTGGISISALSFPDINEKNKMNLKFGMRYKVLEENHNHAISLMDEILYHTRFEDTKRLLELVLQMKSRLQTELSSMGNTTSAGRAMAKFSCYAKAQDDLHGVGYYQFICEAEKTLNSSPEKLVDDLKALHAHIIAKDRLIVGLTMNEKMYQKALPKLKTQISKLPLTTEKMAGGEILLLTQNEGLTDASQIQYVSRAGDFTRHGFEYVGTLRLLRLILSYDYLWNNVRVKGGAYGCGSSFMRTGECYFSSYRDPNLSKTNQIYEKIPEYLRNFQPDDREMTGYVIGTFGAMDTPMNPEAKGQRSMNSYFTGITFDILQKERTEILNATQKDIQALAPMIEAVLSDGHFCVVGNEKNIEDEKELFDVINKLCE